MTCRFSHLFSLFLKYSGSSVPVRPTYSYVICLSHSNIAAIEESLWTGCWRWLFSWMDYYWLLSTLNTPVLERITRTHLLYPHCSFLRLLLLQHYGSVRANAGRCSCHNLLWLIFDTVLIGLFKSLTWKPMEKNPLVKMLRVLRTVLCVRFLWVSLQTEHADLVKLQRWLVLICHCTSQWISIGSV